MKKFLCGFTRVDKEPAEKQSNFILEYSPHSVFTGRVNGSHRVTWRAVPIFYMPGFSSTVSASPCHS